MIAAENLLIPSTALILTHRCEHFCIHSLDFCRAGILYP